MESYAAFIEERMAEARTRCEDPRIFIEQTVRFEEYVPGGFGTSDAIILSDGVMDVIDLKYGKGVPVSAEGNPQMRIYGLGCYLALSWGLPDRHHPHDDFSAPPGQHFHRQHDDRRAADLGRNGAEAQGRSGLGGEG
ncbi:MAG: DUF2800 domain-containing protein [Oscillospiraceae bacterium]